MRAQGGLDPTACPGPRTKELACTDMSLCVPQGSGSKPHRGINSNLQVFVSLVPSWVSWRLWGKRPPRTGWKPCKYFKSLGTGERFRGNTQQLLGTRALGSGRLGQISALPPTSWGLLGELCDLSVPPSPVYSGGPVTPLPDCAPSPRT